MTRPLDASLAVYEADSATILLVFYQHEADYATILPHFLQYEADSAANLPFILLYEADRAAILLPNWRFRLSHALQTVDLEDIYRLVSKILAFMACGSVLNRFWTEFR